MEEKVLKQNVGIDVSMNDFDVCFSDYDSSIHVKVQGSGKFKNTEEGFHELEEWLNPKRKTGLSLHVTMEVTGVYYEKLAYYLYGKGYKVHVLLPNRTKGYSKSLGVKSKTDKIDAKTLSKMGLEQDLRIWEPTSSELLILKQLTRERSALIVERTIVSNQLHAHSHQGKPHQKSISRFKERISFIDGQIKDIMKEITKRVNHDKILSKKLGYMMSMPGMGFLTAVTIAAETNGFASTTSIKQLVSYAGLDVRIAESGKWKGKSTISKKGNKYLRKAMYMPSMSKIRHDANTKQFYEKLKDRKGEAMIANVAVQRKMLGLAYILWTKEEMFSDTIGSTVEGALSTTSNSEAIESIVEDIQSPALLTSENIPVTKKLRKSKTPAKQNKLGKTSKKVLPTKKLRKSKTPAIQDKLPDNVS